MKKIYDAFNNILSIKDSTGQTKKSNDKLYKIMLFLGIFNLFYFGITIIQAMIINPPVYKNFYIVNIFLKIVFYILFFVYFIKIYREEKISSNKYYLSFLSVFAGIIFLLPLLQYIITMMFAFNASIEDSANLAIQIQSLNRTFNIILLCISITICSQILKKKSIKIFAVIVLFMYLLISLIYNEIEFNIGLNVYSMISLSRIFYNLAVSIGYIIIALMLRHSENDANAVA